MCYASRLDIVSNYKPMLDPIRLFILTQAGVMKYCVFILCCPFRQHRNTFLVLLK